ncbi:hypothetical protein D3C87_2068160 [compost metagenome]
MFRNSVMAVEASGVADAICHDMTDAERTEMEGLTAGMHARAMEIMAGRGRRFG